MLSDCNLFYYFVEGFSSSLDIYTDTTFPSQRLFVAIDNRLTIKQTFKLIKTLIASGSKTIFNNFSIS